MITTTFNNRLVPVFLAILRIMIGWQFLYEGLIKVLNPAWSARQYLESSRWIFGDLFRWLASSDTSMWIINAANGYGLTLIGLALILGLFTRLASWSGVAMLLMYYLAYPPFGSFSYGAPAEGSYMIVNKNLIELFALVVLAMTQSGLYFGLDKLIHRKKTKALPEKPEKVEETEKKEETSSTDINRRREFVKSLAGLPVLAVFSGAFLKSLSEKGTDGISGASAITVDAKKLADVKGNLPAGNLGDLKISRMIMGCNLIGGWSHGRDLIYTDSLFKAYNNEKKIIETLYLGEKAGMNTTLMVSQFYGTFNKYKKIYNSNMQSICQTMLPEKDFFSGIDKAIDNGATALYIQGNEGDNYVMKGKVDMIAKAIEHIKKQGFLAGVGAHSLETIKTCEREGIPSDFYVKTFHHDKYWSASPMENREDFTVIKGSSPDRNKHHDNMWDMFPLQTIEFMKEVNKPWIAFKVLAAGAIQPKVGFRYAFENGADFIAVGMFDFQVVNNVNTATQILGDLKNRERKWYS
jgi:uncharacterized membrane protein YphA (DoxX/SURF4 family)